MPSTDWLLPPGPLPGPADACAPARLAFAERASPAAAAPAADTRARRRVNLRASVTVILLFETDRSSRCGCKVRNETRMHFTSSNARNWALVSPAPELNLAEESSMTQSPTADTFVEALTAYEA